LRELLAALVQLANEWLDLLMNNLVRAHIASLSKSLAADVAVVGTLASMTALVSLVKVSLVFADTKPLTLRFPS
jgi:hypothetical protein